MLSVGEGCGAECLAYFSDWGPTFVEWIDDSSCNVLFEDDFTAKRALVGRGKPLPPEASGPDTAGALLIRLSLGSQECLPPPALALASCSTCMYLTSELFIASERSRCKYLRVWCVLLLLTSSMHAMQKCSPCGGCLVKSSLRVRFRALLPAAKTGLDPSDINNAPFLWHKGDDFVKAGTPIPLMYRMATTADVRPEKGKKFSRYLWKLPAKQARSLFRLVRACCFRAHFCWCMEAFVPPMTHPVVGACKRARSACIRCHCMFQVLKARGPPVVRHAGSLGMKGCVCLHRRYGGRSRRCRGSMAGQQTGTSAPAGRKRMCT